MFLYLIKIEACFKYNYIRANIDTNPDSLAGCSGICILYRIIENRRLVSVSISMLYSSCSGTSSSQPRFFLFGHISFFSSWGFSTCGFYIFADIQPSSFLFGHHSQDGRLPMNLWDHFRPYAGGFLLV